MKTEIEKKKKKKKRDFTCWATAAQQQPTQQPNTTAQGQPDTPSSQNIEDEVVLILSSTHAGQHDDVLPFSSTLATSQCSTS